MTSVESVIAANLDRVREQINAACRRAGGRDPAEVRLVAVTKSARIPWIETLVSLGVHDLGESRPQQLVERAAMFGASVCWHLVGHLQRNKVRKVLPAAKWIHSVDSLPLLTRLDETARELRLRPRVLLEVNVSGEKSKEGFRPEDLQANFDGIVSRSNVEITGLMTMAPLADRAESARPTFTALRELRNELAPLAPRNTLLTELSMGMSGDFEVAVEEGATIVRVGTKLFERLKAND